MMKKSKLRLWALPLSLALCFAGGGGAVAALAATQESELTNVLIDTSDGTLFEMDWKISGEKQTAYTIDNRGHFARYDDSNGLPGCYWLMSGTPVACDKDVTMEFDLLSFAPDTYFGLCAWESTIDAMPSWNAAYFDFMYSGFPSGWFPQAQQGNRYRLSLSKTGAASVSVAPIKADGNYTDEDFTVAGTATGDYYAAKVPKSGSCYFGLKMHTGNDGNKVVEIDNFVLKADNAEVISCDFEDESKITGVAPVEGKMSLQLATVAQVCEIKVVDPAADNRIVMAAESKGIQVDEQIGKCATVTASLRLDEVSGNDKAGLSFGLASDTQAATATGSSFVYLYNEGATTYINAMNDGTAGSSPISLGKDYTGEFVDLTLEISSDGTTAVFVNGTELSNTLKLTHLAGMVAVDHVSDGGIKYSVGKDLIVKNYAYLGGTGGDVGINFNNDFINEEKFIGSLAGTASQFVDASLAKGVVVEDGKLFFKGSSDGDYIGFSGTYADFILEFEYTNFLESQRPATQAQISAVEGATNGAYSPLIIQMNAAGLGYSGAPGTGDKIVFYDGSLYKDILTGGSMGTLMRWEAHKSGTSDSGIILENGCTADSNANAVVAPGKVGLYGRTTQFKIVAANGEVKVYAFNIADGKTFADYTDADYVLLATYKTKNCYGYVGIASSESGYFQIDNLRITNIDGKSEEEVNAKIAAYKSLQAIADESRLARPTVTLEGNVAMWKAIDKATGYEIVINDGVAQKVGKDVLSYTFGQTEAGNYKLVVHAIYEGSENIHSSEASKAVTYKVEEQQKPSDGDKGGGCGSVIGGGVALSAALILLGTATVVRRKRA